MKRIVLILVLAVFCLSVFATEDFVSYSNSDNRITILTQYMDNYHNVRISWEDNVSTSDDFVYIITSGNTDDDNEFMVKGYTDEQFFNIYHIANLSNQERYNVYKVSYNDRSDITDVFDTGDATMHQVRRTLTWDEIKRLLKRKSGNIWKLRRNNIPTTIK